MKTVMLAVGMPIFKKIPRCLFGVYQDAQSSTPTSLKANSRLFKASLIRLCIFQSLSAPKRQDILQNYPLILG